MKIFFTIAYFDFEFFYVGFFKLENEQLFNWLTLFYLLFFLYITLLNNWQWNAFTFTKSVIKGMMAFRKNDRRLLEPWFLIFNCYLLSTRQHWFFIFLLPSQQIKVDFLSLMFLCLLQLYQKKIISQLITKKPRKQ